MLTITKQPTVRKLPKSPEENPVDGSNCLTLCLYNIPRGGLTIVMPALVLLVTGLAVLGVMVSSPIDDGRRSDWPTLVTPVAVSCVGLAWTTAGAVYWTIMWCKHRPRSNSASRQRSASFDECSSIGIDDGGTVELVGIYWLS